MHVQFQPVYDAGVAIPGLHRVPLRISPAARARSLPSVCGLRFIHSDCSCTENAAQACLQVVVIAQHVTDITASNKTIPPTPFKTGGPTTAPALYCIVSKRSRAMLFQAAMPAARPLNERTGRNVVLIRAEYARSLHPRCAATIPCSWAAPTLPGCGLQDRWHAPSRQNRARYGPEIQTHSRSRQWHRWH